MMITSQPYKDRTSGKPIFQIHLTCFSPLLPHRRKQSIRETICFVLAHVLVQLLLEGHLGDFVISSARRRKRCYNALPERKNNTRQKNSLPNWFIFLHEVMPPMSHCAQEYDPMKLLLQPPHEWRQNRFLHWRTLSLESLQNAFTSGRSPTRKKLFSAILTSSISPTRRRI